MRLQKEVEKDGRSVKGDIKKIVTKMTDDQSYLELKPGAPYGIRIR